MLEEVYMKNIRQAAFLTLKDIGLGNETAINSTLGAKTFITPQVRSTPDVLKIQDINISTVDGENGEIVIS